MEQIKEQKKNILYKKGLLMSHTEQRNMNTLVWESKGDQHDIARENR